MILSFYIRFLISKLKTLNMARAFFEYTKIILEKVSFDKNIFKRELAKANKLMLPHERKELMVWFRAFCIKRPELSDLEFILIKS